MVRRLHLISDRWADDFELFEIMTKSADAPYSPAVLCLWYQFLAENINYPKVRGGLLQPAYEEVAWWPVKVGVADLGLFEAVKLMCKPQCNRGHETAYLIMMHANFAVYYEEYRRLYSRLREIKEDMDEETGETAYIRDQKFKMITV